MTCRWDVDNRFTGLRSKLRIKRNRKNARHLSTNKLPDEKQILFRVILPVLHVYCIHVHYVCSIYGFDVIVHRGQHKDYKILRCGRPLRKNNFGSIIRGHS